MAELKIAPDEETGRAIEDAIWRQWIKAPDSRAQDLLDRGMQRRDAYDFEAAEQLFDELVAYCPHYPEGYNQRAFIRFLRERYDAALWYFSARAGSSCRKRRCAKPSACTPG